MRVAGVRAGLLLAFAVFALLAPTQIGGRASYVTTSGVSMQPNIEAGDLVLVRRASSYRVGDVVAYRSSSLDGAVVLHRIIGIRGDHYLLKGDRNNFVDPAPPTRDRVVGRMWLDVPHAGGVLRSLFSPGRALLLAALSVLLLGGGTYERRRRRARGDGPARTWVARLPLPTVGAAAGDALLKPALGLLLAGVLLGVVAFSRPTERPSTRGVAYRQTGVFGYSAASRDASVYPDGRARTGEPVFTRLSDVVDLSFAYQLSSAATLRASGAADLSATIRDSTGWTRSLELQDWRRFDGSRVVLNGRLSLRALRETIARLDTASGVTHGAFTIDVTPRVAVEGAVAGKALETSFQPVLSFVLDSNQLQLSTRIGSAGAEGDGTRPIATGSVELPAREPALLSLGRVKARVVVARRLAMVLLMLGLGGLLLLMALRRAEKGCDEAALIASRYRSLLVPFPGLDPVAYPQVVEVASMKALARIAAGYDRMILHAESARGDSYFVIDDGVVHAYRIGDALFEAEAPAPAPDVEPAKAHLGLVRTAS